MLTTFWFFEHLKREGLKADDEVVIFAGGAWTAEGGPLRLGLEALWQYLVDYGVHAIIADDVYAAAPCLPPVSALHLDHPLTRTLFGCSLASQGLPLTGPGAAGRLRPSTRRPRRSRPHQQP